MLSAKDNDLITRVEGDAPAGQVLRRYWLPACLSEELVAGNMRALHVRMMGQDFAAFRDTDGSVALIDERGAAQRVREAGDLVWTYLGPPELEPAFPLYDFLQVPSEQRAIVKIGARCNYVQSLEGAIDSAHSWFLHRGTARDWERRKDVSSDVAPRLEAEDTDYGFRYAAIRKPNVDADTMKYVRVTNFLMPTTALIPRPLHVDQFNHIEIFVPVDDHHTYFYGFYVSQDGRPVSTAAMRERMAGRPGIDLDDEWFKQSGRHNWYAQDRAAMKCGDWSGIAGVPHQDMACQETMGPIVDRSREHLGTSDLAIIRMRKRMLDSINGFLAGKPPAGLERDVPYGRVRSEQLIIPIGQPWQSVGAYAGEYDRATASST